MQKIFWLPIMALTLFGLAFAAGTNDVKLDCNKDAEKLGFRDPISWLTRIPRLTKGEPINLVVSSKSDAKVLTPEGIIEYFQSLFFSPNNCAGLDLGDRQAANLNDGKGYVNQSELYRQNDADGTTDTCRESIYGGNHFRLWKQTTTGAYFLAASVEKNALENHDIVANGYNLGRDYIVGNATNATGTTSPQTKGKFKTTVAYYQHNIPTSQINHGIAVDGKIAVLTVHKTS